MATEHEMLLDFRRRILNNRFKMRAAEEWHSAAESHAHFSQSWCYSRGTGTDFSDAREPVSKIFTQVTFGLFQDTIFTD
eukprot:1187443-Amphidinium_carterae.1